jgi:hypothetical protein
VVVVLIVNMETGNSSVLNVVGLDYVYIVNIF